MLICFITVWDHIGAGGGGGGSYVFLVRSLLVSRRSFLNFLFCIHSLIK